MCVFHCMRTQQWGSQNTKHTLNFFFGSLSRALSNNRKKNLFTHNLVYTYGFFFVFCICFGSFALSLSGCMYLMCVQFNRQITTKRVPTDCDTGMRERSLQFSSDACVRDSVYVCVYCHYICCICNQLNSAARALSHSLFVRATSKQKQQTLHISPHKHTIAYRYTHPTNMLHTIH